MVRGNKSIFSHGLIAATLLAVSFAARAEMTYTITSYPAGLADLPCDAFKKILTGRGRRSPFSLRAALSSSASISRIPTRRASSRASATRNRDWRLGSCCRRAQISDQAATKLCPRGFPTSFSGLLRNLFAFLLWKRCRARSSAFRAPKLSASCSSSGVEGRFSTCPVVMSPTSLSAWEKSVGCLARLRFVAPPSLSHRWREFWLGLCWSCLGRLSGMSANMRRSA